eukprot:scaffold285773_cov17-Tisochrysis_lutea.AAC.1
MGACQSSHLLQKDPDWRQYVDQEWKSQRAKVLDRALGACVGCAGGKHMPQKVDKSFFFSALANPRDSWSGLS